MTIGRPVFELRGITKAFGGTRALDGVDLTLDAGSVHALVGENGAGKSTLIKIMTGAYRRDAGTIALEGRPVSFPSPHEAQADGVVAIYQEVHVLSFSTVAEMLFLGREPTRFGLVDHRGMATAAAELLARLELDLDPRARVGELPIAQRQMVAIARGVSVGARVLILDEPTSSLTTREVAQLFALVRRLRDDGVALAYVSHRMDEIYALCDRVTILRDGRRVDTRAVPGSTVWTWSARCWAAGARRSRREPLRSRPERVRRGTPVSLSSR
jgi:monosaccharide-transporting ATPase